jgi:hypothetical protein
LRRSHTNTRDAAALLAVVPLLVFLAACGGQTPEVAEETPEPAADAPAAAPTPGDAEVEAKLALADAADGTTDHIVSLCAGCALGMEGSPDYELDVAGYEMHFCSEGCLDRFAKDPKGAVMALAIPASPDSETPEAGGK